MINAIEKQLCYLRSQNPVVLNLTNQVTMDFMANALLALGAAPIMSVCDEELEELIQIASAVNINIGTLDDAFINRCIKAASLAQKYKKSIVLDPVGSGATTKRTQSALKLLSYANIIKGNASEIMSLKTVANTRGVESNASVCQAKDIAREIASQHQNIIVVSGAVDFIASAKQTSQVAFGSNLMPLVTGMGCVLGATLAAFAAVDEDHFQSSVFGTTYFGLVGALASEKTKHPGTFKTNFIDALHQADFERMKIHTTQFKETI